MNFFRHLRDTFVPSETNHYRPHALSRKSITLFGGLILTMKVLALFSINAIPVGQAYSSAVTPSNIIELTNQSRAGSNLAPLTENTALDAAAQAKANDMLAKQYFAHVSPSGETPWDFIANTKYNYIIAGENLAINYFTAEGVEQAWMNSPGHRANILNSNFENIGIGVTQGQYQGFPAIFVVQMFGTPLPQNYTIQPSNTITAPASAAVQTSTSDGSSTGLQNAIPAAASSVAATETGITVNAKTSSLLDTPTLNQPTKVLVSGNSATVSGTANTEDVYIYINGKAQAEYPVKNGVFSAPVNLDPGNNVITAVGYNGTNIISQFSAAISLITAIAPPEVLSAQVTPIPGDGGSSLTYQIVVHTAPSVAEVIANYGNGAVMLQPTATAGEWQAALLPDLSSSNAALVVQAYDMAGNTVNSSQITFSSSIADNYAFNAPAITQTIPILGINVSANALNNFYVYLSLALLLILGIAIASKISTADVAMVAQVSGLVAISIIFWAH